MDEMDVVVIGGGPAGFIAGQIASQLGGKVLLIENDRVGGICPNWGCIPMCFMDHCVEVIRSVKAAGNYGINTGEARIDYTKLMSEKNKIVQGKFGKAVRGSSPVKAIGYGGSAWESNH